MDHSMYHPSQHDFMESYVKKNPDSGDIYGQADESSSSGRVHSWVCTSTPAAVHPGPGGAASALSAAGERNFPCYLLFND